jgi:putative flippase GtrA
MRSLRFVTTNLCGTVIETSVLAALGAIWDRALLAYVLAPVLAFEVSVVHNFVASYLWVWPERVARGDRDLTRRLARYNLGVATVFLGRLALIVALGAGFGLPAAVSNLLALLVSGVVNYAVQDRIVFRSA